MENKIKEFLILIIKIIKEDDEENVSKFAADFLLTLLQKKTFYSLFHSLFSSLLPSFVLFKY